MEEKESLALNTLKYKEGNASTLNENTEYVTDVVIKELPSGFKGYPENTKISYVPMTFEEIEALNSSEMDPERAIAMLLKAIHCTTLPSYDLYYWDVMYIGIQRKLLAFGDTNGTLYKRCPKCGNLVSKSFSYTELEFKELEVPALPMRMELFGRKVEFGLLTIKDILEIDPNDGELGVYARLIRNIPFEEAFELVKKATGSDIKKLRFADKQLNYGIKPFFVNCENPITVESPNGKKTEKCGQRVALEVRSPFEIVFPEDELSQFDEIEVQYG